MTYNITRIWDRYREIMRMSLLGMKQVQIAERLELSPVTVGYVLNNPLIRQQIEILQAGRDQSAVNIGEQIEEIAPKAIAYMNEVLDGIQLDPLTGDPVVSERDSEGNPVKIAVHSPELRQKVAKDLIGMAGFGPVQRVKATVTHGIFTPEDIAKFKERAREAGIVKSQYSDKPPQGEIKELSASQASPIEFPSLPPRDIELVNVSGDRQPAQLNYLENV
jgi:hypothetical protein